MNRNLRHSGSDVGRPERAEGNGIAVKGIHALWRNSAIPMGLPIQMYINSRERKTLIDWTMQSFSLTKAINQVHPMTYTPLSVLPNSSWITSRGTQVFDTPDDSLRHMNSSDGFIWPRLFQPFSLNRSLQDRMCPASDEFVHHPSPPVSSTCVTAMTKRSSSFNETRPCSYSSYSSGVPTKNCTNMPRSYSSRSARPPTTISPIQWLNPHTDWIRQGLSQWGHSAVKSPRTDTSPNHLTEVPTGTEDAPDRHRRFLTNLLGNPVPWKQPWAVEVPGEVADAPASAMLLCTRKVSSGRRAHNESFMRVVKAFDRPSPSVEHLGGSSSWLLDRSLQQACSDPDVPKYHFAAYENVGYVQTVLQYVTTKGTCLTKVLDPLRNKFDMIKAIEIDTAATTIQTMFRGYRAKKKRLLVSQLVSFFTDANRAARVIQTNWRRLRAQKELTKRKYIKQLLKVRSKAAVTIQRTYREKLSHDRIMISMAAQAHILTRQVGAMVIQKSWRGFLVRRKVAVEFEMFTLRWPFDNINHFVEVIGTFTFPPWKQRILLNWDNDEGVYLTRLARRPGTYEIQFIVDGEIVLHGGLPLIPEEVVTTVTSSPNWSFSHKHFSSTAGDNDSSPGRGMRNVLKIEANDKRYQSLNKTRDFLLSITSQQFISALESVMDLSKCCMFDSSAANTPRPAPMIDIDQTVSRWMDRCENSDTPINELTHSGANITRKWKRDIVFNTAITWVNSRLGQDDIVNAAMASHETPIKTLGDLLEQLPNQYGVMQDKDREIYLEVNE
eukprot:GHVH01013257.1.p1 GENE.GHVH01013257.1~~GHVH01013257.1.p1  ORF type:complete len:779 (+),score=107.46 GHVH01013257.1:416-2752(+)